MGALPKPLIGHLARTSVQERSAAWLRVDDCGRVRDCGGDLAAYGLSPVRKGDAVATRAPYLDGVLSRRDPDVMLPLVRVDQDRYADVHVVPQDEGSWVLLLDATERARVEMAKQQHSYDLALALEESRKRELAGVVRALGVVVLRHVEAERYEVLGEVPDWATPWAEATLELRPAGAWPFLEAFLPDAVRFCAEGSQGVLRSGPWIETLDDGASLALEAVAVRSDRRGCLVLIERLVEGLQEKQRLIQRARERELAHQRLLRDGQEKDVLLHCIVHDLNNPLTAIMGSLGLLAGGLGDPDQAKSLAGMALRQARRQARLIRNISDVFRAEVGALRNEDIQDVVDVGRCAAEIAQEYMPACARKEIPLRVRVDEAIGPLEARGESARLFRVFGNLLDNAVRHTPRGGYACIRVHRMAETVVGVVENDGADVPEALRPHLFEKFTRAQETGGLAGLGLFFCRMTLRRWGGDIEYAPRPEGGSSFRFWLPAAGAL